MNYNNYFKKIAFFVILFINFFLMTKHQTKKLILGAQKLKTFQQNVGQNLSHKKIKPNKYFYSVYDLLSYDPNIEYIKIHDEAKYHYKPLPYNEFKELRQHKGLMAETFIVRIKNGQVGTPIGIVASNNIIIKECFPPFFNEKYFFNRYKNIDIENIKKISGKIAVITTHNHTIYGHWIFNVLTRLALLEMHNITYDYLYVSQKLKYQKETLALWGIPCEKIIEPLEENEFLQADEIIMPCHPAYKKREPWQYDACYIPYDRYIKEYNWPHMNVPSLSTNLYDSHETIPSNIPLKNLFHQWNPLSGVAFYRKDIIEYIRNKYLSCLPPNDFNFSKRVFISRADSKKRLTINENKILQALQPYGFKKYVLTNMTYLEQVALFNQAEIIIGIQGSGLLNILYCNPQAIICEIFQTYLCPDLYYLFQSLCLNKYYSIKPLNINDCINYSQPKLIPIDSIKNFIKTLALKEIPIK